MVALATTGVPGLDVRRARCKQQPDAAERTLAETCKRFTQRGRLSVPAIPPFARSHETAAAALQEGFGDWKSRYIGICSLRRVML
jgi:hypothetical protein